MHYYHLFLVKAGTWHTTATMLCKTYGKFWTSSALTFQSLSFLKRIDWLWGERHSPKLFLQRESRHPYIEGIPESKMNPGDDPYVDKCVKTRAKWGNHQSGRIKLAWKIIKSGSKLCIWSVSRLMRGVRQKRLFRCAIAFWLKLNSSAFFQLCRHLWAKCLSPVSNFSLANAEFREIFSHFR